MPTIETRSLITASNRYQRQDYQPSLPVNEGPASDVFSGINRVEEHSTRIIENEITEDKPWSAFGQTIFVRENEQSDGSKIKKIAAVSMSYPSGVGERMGEEILRRTLSQESFATIHAWDGVEEGKLLAIKQMGIENLTLLDRFIDISGEVIQQRHGQLEHEFVRDFFKLQESRRAYLPRVKQDTLNILTTPFFTGRSAFNPDYKDKGVYVLEMIYENGVLYGATPDGDQRALSEIAADEPHKQWLLWLEKEISQPGDMIIGHVDSTETVRDCGGNGKCCSKFFEEMEGKVKQIFSIILAGNNTEYSDMFYHPTIATSFSESEKKKICGGCKHEKVDCRCERDETVSQAA